MDTTTDMITPAPLLVDAREAARLCGVSRTTWLSLSQQGLTPEPLRLGRRVLWRVAELRAWTAAGCPARSRWAEMQEKRS
jgi:predicted DNA-binding transcriptional regulator AlpA